MRLASFFNLYGSLWLPLWLSLALTATLWHTLGSRLSGILSALGSQRRCHADALFPALVWQQFSKERKTSRALAGSGQCTFHITLAAFVCFFPALSFNRCFTISAYGYGCRIREGKTTLRSRSMQIPYFIHRPPFHRWIANARNEHIRAGSGVNLVQKSDGAALLWLWQALSAFSYSSFFHWTPFPTPQVEQNLAQWRSSFSFIDLEHTVS